MDGKSASEQRRYTYMSQIMEEITRASLWSKEIALTDSLFGDEFSKTMKEWKMNLAAKAASKPSNICCGI